MGDRSEKMTKKKLGFSEPFEPRHEHKLVEKAWGSELWIENCDEYCGKLLHIHAGHAGSMHFHINKKETMYVVQGALKVSSIDPTTCMSSSIVVETGSSILIEPGRLHQLEAHEGDVVIVEFSTTHHDSDSYRVHPGK